MLKCKLESQDAYIGPRLVSPVIAAPVGHPLIFCSLRGAQVISNCATAVSRELQEEENDTCMQEPFVW